jgi:Taurine catabolism dioxygenase TauD, TfdA family
VKFDVAAAVHAIKEFGFVVGQVETNLADVLIERLAGELGELVPSDSSGLLTRTLVDKSGSFRLEQPMHVDGGDYVILVCISGPISGGDLCLAEINQVVQLIESTDRRSFEQLTQQWRFSRRGRGGKPYFEAPVFWRVDSQWRAHLLPGLIAEAADFHGDGLSSEEEKALATAEVLARSVARTIEMKPGTVVGFDNRRFLHGRESYEDSHSAQRKVIRGWVSERGPNGWRARKPAGQAGPEFS